MCHQTTNSFDIGFTVDPQTINKENFDYLVSLLVKKELKNLKSKTSNPKRVLESLMKQAGADITGQLQVRPMLSNLMTYLCKS